VITVEIVFFNASRQLPLDIEREIRAGINDGVAAMSQHVKVENIGIAAILDGFTAAETGLAGWHFGPDACILWIDEENSNLGTDPRRRSATVIAHELHHVLRARTCPWKQKDLCAGEVIASGAKQSRLFSAASWIASLRSQ